MDISAQVQEVVNGYIQTTNKIGQDDPDTAMPLAVLMDPATLVWSKPADDMG